MRTMEIPPFPRKIEIRDFNNLFRTRLFQRADSVEAGWQAVQPFLDAWKKAGPHGLEIYQAGSGGPEKADELLKLDGRAWRTAS